MGGQDDVSTAFRLGLVDEPQGQFGGGAAQVGAPADWEGNPLRAGSSRSFEQARSAPHPSEQPIQDAFWTQVGHKDRKRLTRVEEN